MSAEALDAILTNRQLEARELVAGDASHIMLFGGSRSGKTFALVLFVVVRAMVAPGSRHVIFRHRFLHVKSSIGMDTLPKVMAVCFPGVKYDLNKTDWRLTLPNGSEVWLAGLDDKERTEKILGNEFATLYFNECSQIGYSERNMALTRLAQRVNKIDGQPLRLKVFYDCNPPSKSHWTYRLFVGHRDPDTQEPVSRPEQYAAMLLNPTDNADNLPPEYISTLEALPARMRMRFLEGKFADDVAGALWRLEDLETWRALDTLPDMVRVVVAVDPSGSGDADNADNDEIGIVVAGLGADGNGYVLEDLTVKAGPATWGNVVTTAYDRHMADAVVAEENYGGAMVRHVIQTARPRTPYRSVRASRGKAVRAEPISALYENGKIRHAGHFAKLEDEMCSFSTAGFMGSGSPNRVDAMVWAFTDLFPMLTKGDTAPRIKLASQISLGKWIG